MNQATTILIATDQDVIIARSAVRELAYLLGFTPMDQARITTGVSEMARTIYLHAGRVRMTARTVEQVERRGLELEFYEENLQIRSLEQAVSAICPMTRQIGTGLVGAQRLMDEFELQPEPDKGTIIRCRKWYREPRQVPAPRSRQAG